MHRRPTKPAPPRRHAGRLDQQEVSALAFLRVGPNSQGERSRAHARKVFDILTSVGGLAVGASSRLATRPERSTRSTTTDPEASQPT